ncbi:MAG: hypothetical protein JST54_29485 [Deltaproteobacteria bacterium]|nr:hypothetical protein [Deltaproteobacteria bacterium]
MNRFALIGLLLLGSCVRTDIDDTPVEQIPDGGTTTVDTDAGPTSVNYPVIPFTPGSASWGTPEPGCDVFTPGQALPVTIDDHPGVCVPFDCLADAVPPPSVLPAGRRIFWEWTPGDWWQLPDAGVYGVLDQRGGGVDDGGLLDISVEDDFADAGGIDIPVAGGTVQIFSASSERLTGHADVLIALPDAGTGVLDFDFNATTCP